MKTKMIAAVIGISSMLTAGTALAGHHETGHDAMTKDNTYHGERSRAERIAGGYDKNKPNPTDAPVMEGKAAYGMSGKAVPSRGDKLKGGYDKNKPNDVTEPVLENAPRTVGPNNEGYDEVTGPLN